MKNINKKDIVQPVLKWVGGKRQLLDVILPLIPNDINRYVEPFLGGGAVFFSLQSEKALINDYNKELINVYNIVKKDLNLLISKLEEYQEKNCKESFYQIRELDRKENYKYLSNIDKAARTMYLNKTCYNGLYRVNKKGQFNTPFGSHKNVNIVNEDLIRKMSAFLNANDIQIFNEDYKKILSEVKKGDFVYLDPPYVPLSISSNFTSYTENGFGLKEQEELKLECDKLNKKGVKFLLSNSDSPLIRELYADYDIIIVKANRFINSKSNKRGKINEVLVKNYDI